MPAKAWGFFYARKPDFVNEKVFQRKQYMRKKL